MMTEEERARLDAYASLMIKVGHEKRSYDCSPGLQEALASGSACCSVAGRSVPNGGCNVHPEQAYPRRGDFAGAITPRSGILACMQWQDYRRGRTRLGHGRDRRRASRHYGTGPVSGVGLDQREVKRARSRHDSRLTDFEPHYKTKARLH